MTGTHAMATVLDSPKDGMPLENLVSLRAFLAARRSELQERKAKEISSVVKGLPGELQTLPQGAKEKFAAFLIEVESTNLCGPRGTPNPEWRVRRSISWKAAKVEAEVMAKREHPERVLPDAGAGETFDGDNVGRAADHAAQKVLLNGDIYYAWSMGRRLIRKAVDEHVTELCTGDMAVFDAALLAGYIMMEGVDFPDKEKYFEHAKRRWDVWKKGYALLCDVDGTLYVYYQDQSGRE